MVDIISVDIRQGDTVTEGFLSIRGRLRFEAWRSERQELHTILENSGKEDVFDLRSLGVWDSCDVRLDEAFLSLSPNEEVAYLPIIHYWGTAPKETRSVLHHWCTNKVCGLVLSKSSNRNFRRLGCFKVTGHTAVQFFLRVALR
jgi:hypothetical protein